NLTITGHVIAVASAATVNSGVVNYYATIVLNQTDKALKQGMTANATVTVSKATNALSVPNLAISHTAGQAYVNVYAAGQQVATPVETGVAGDQFTEVTGGLNDGEQIVLPTVRVSSGTGTNRGGTLGGGGVRVGAGGCSHSRRSPRPTAWAGSRSRRCRESTSMSRRASSWPSWAPAARVSRL